MLWAAAGRSHETRRRAAQAGLLEVADVASLAQQCDTLISVCPPDAAAPVARSVADHGFAGTYVDANAVSPESATEIAHIVESAGAAFVDGSLIGPPAVRAGSTRLYLTGGQAPRVASFFEGSVLDAMCLAAPPPAASALKMCYAGFTKGNAALLIAIRALSQRLGVEDALLEEWDISQPELADRSERSARATAPKAWRFEGEMEEIAATFTDAGLPGGFHEAAGELYRRLAEFKDGKVNDLDEVLSALLESEDAPSTSSDPSRP